MWTEYPGKAKAGSRMLIFIKEEVVHQRLILGVLR